MVLFVFQFYPVINFGQFINFGFGTVRSERVCQGVDLLHELFDRLSMN